MPRAGFIRTPEQHRYDLITRGTPEGDGGERIIIATDRRIGFWEAANQPRSIDYPFTLIEMRDRLKRQGRRQDVGRDQDHDRKGRQDNRARELQSQPVMLNNVTREKKT